MHFSPHFIGILPYLCSQKCITNQKQQAAKHESKAIFPDDTGCDAMYSNDSQEGPHAG
jgi:hypothetical protein